MFIATLAAVLLCLGADAADWTVVRDKTADAGARRRAFRVLLADADPEEARRCLLALYRGCAADRFPASSPEATLLHRFFVDLMRRERAAPERWLRTKSYAEFLGTLFSIEGLSPSVIEALRSDHWLETIDRCEGKLADESERAGTN